MSYVDNGDDELDYEDEDYTEPGPAYEHGTGAIAALAEDEMEDEEEDYEDLYQDVDVGFFESTEGAGEDQDATGERYPNSGENFTQDATSERYPNSGENGVEDYGDEEYAEYERTDGRAREIEDESYPVEGQEEYDGEREQPELAESVRNVRAKTEGGDFEQPGDYGDDEDLTGAEVVLEQQHSNEVGDVDVDVDEGDIIPEDEEDLHVHGGEEAPDAAEMEVLAEAPLVRLSSNQAEIVEGSNRPVDYGARAAPGSAITGAQVVKSEDRDYVEEDARIGRIGAVTPLQKPKIEGEQQRTESQLVKSAADRGGRKSTGWANGSGPSASSEGGAGKGGVRSDGGASGSWPAAAPGGRGGGGGGSAPPASVAAVSAPPPPAANREAPNSTASDYTAKHAGSSHQHEAGGIMLFVGELHWWTTDAELEAALSEYGRVKNLKFYEEKASGRSKGYCQVEFYEAGAARVCKEKMDGRIFNDRPCVVAFASPQTIKQMGAAQVGKNQIQSQHGQAGGGPGRGRGESGAGGRGAAGSQMGDGGRGYSGREKMPMGGRGGGPEGRGRGPGRGRGGNIGGRGGAGGAHFGQGPPGPMGGGPGGMIPPQAMMGGGFDPGFGPPMGGRGGYGMGPGGPGGGFGPRGPFGVGPGMGPPFPNMGPGLPGVAPHVNPAFFGRGNGNGPGIGMDGPAGGWGEGPMPGWAGDEHERRMVYGDEMGGPDYGYPGEMGPDRLRGGPPRERDRMVEGDWAGVDRRRREDRGDGEWAGERHRERGTRDEYWDREQGREKDKEWSERERGPRGREKVRAAPIDEEERPRSRDEDFGKRRRMVADRKIER